MDTFERKAVAWFLNGFAEIIESDDGPEFIGNILKEVADDHDVPDDVRDDFKVMFDELVETAKESYLEYLEKTDDEG